MPPIPEFLVHYYLPDSKPFANLSELSIGQRKPIVEQLHERTRNGETWREFPDWYFDQRQEAEEKLLSKFTELGGQPERTSPHYFTLGRSVNMEWVYKNGYEMIRVPIKEIESELFFSIGDTLWTFAKSHNPDQEWANKWYQGQLYGYDEMREIITQIRLDLRSKKSLYDNQVLDVEGLIWSDHERDRIIKGTKKAGY